MSQRHRRPGIRRLCGTAAAILVLALQGPAQIQPLFSHPIGGRQDFRPAAAAPDTLRLLVAMVEFQEDNDARTSGTGRFDLGTTAKKLIDPPPHDRAYVVQHMTFAENYFRKASDGRCILVPTVLDSIYRVPLRIQDYSPPRTSTTNAELGLLVNDVWRTVDAASPAIVFSQYDAFMIVHAGVGRDVDLTSIYGYDPTPYDIPSVYMSTASLRKIYGPGYAGVPVDDSTFHVGSSIIIPETEDRDIETITGTVTLELGINGLIVASIGSHLGLPDLFNTTNGRSAIGRFGLMDGQSIFSWSGVFPPEPSAWEKVFLGWVAPVTVPPGSNLYDLPAVSRSGGNDTIYRVPITAREYFLVENRNRDANRDGARVTIVQGGAAVERVWARDTAEGFNAFDQDSLYGVVTDIDEFDWSLPGGVNTRTNEWYEGGILVWHIDEEIIDANYAANTVNADPERRGVDLEEGDGSQDIGESYGFISPGAGSEDGTPFDFWYKGNTATPRVISNVFSPLSHPNSLSNRMANSHITVRDFSVRGPVMQATIQLGDNDVMPLQGFPVQAAGKFAGNAITVADANGDGESDLLLPAAAEPSQGAPAAIFGWKLDGSPILGEAMLVEGSDTLLRSPAKVAVADADGDLRADVTATGTHDVNSIRGWSVTDLDGDLRADTLFSRTVSGTVRGPVVVSDSFIVASGSGGMFYAVARNASLRLDSLNVFNGAVAGAAVYAQPDTFLLTGPGGDLALVTAREIVRRGSIQTSVSGMPAVAVISAAIGKRIVVTDGWGIPHMIDENLRVEWSGLPLVSGAIESTTAPAIADIDNDGQKDVVVVFGNRIYALNARGTSLENFPVTLPTESAQTASSPIVADIDGNGTSDIVVVTREGLVVACDRSGAMVAGFPIQSGSSHFSTLAAFTRPGSCLSCVDICLAVASDDGHLYAWKTGTLTTGPGVPPEQPWPQLFHDARNTGLDDSPVNGAPCTTCGQVSDAYNWPNPVKAEDGFLTRIRYYLTSDASVTVKVFDLAGDLVAELKGQGRGGFDNEIEWDCSAVQSGIYFAHIDAEGASAGSAVIKIAVVR